MTKSIMGLSSGTILRRSQLL